MGSTSWCLWMWLAGWEGCVDVFWLLESVLERVDEIGVMLGSVMDGEVG